MPEFPNPVHVSVTPRGGGGVPLEVPAAVVAVIGAGAFVLANLLVIAGVLAVTAVATAISVGVLRRHMVAGWAPPGTIASPARRPAIAPVHVHFHGLAADEVAQILAGAPQLASLGDDLTRRALEGRKP